MFNVGDFVISNKTAFGGKYPSIVKVIEITPHIKIRHISYKGSYKSYYESADTGLEQQVLKAYVIDYIDIKPFSLEEFAQMLQAQPLIRLSERENLANFLKQKIVEHFNIPPKRAIKAELASNTDKPIVSEGQVSGFIRINNV